MVRRGLWVQALAAAVWMAGFCAAGNTQQSDARLGARRFMEYCAACHGTDGGGGAKGPSLVGDQASGRSDAELFAMVHDGTHGGMPPFAQIGDANITALIHFLRLLENSASGGSAAPQGPPGDADAGRALYFGKGKCSVCHMVNGKGGFMARDLTHFAANRSAETIRSAIVNPDRSLIPTSRVVTVTLRGGQTLTGVLRNEDNFDLDLQTEDGRYHLLKKSSQMRIAYTNHSLMPGDYGTRLSSAELNDLVGFLMSAGKKPEGHEP